MFIDFRGGGEERGREGGRGKEREREREKEKNIHVREKYQLVASCMHPDRGPNLQLFDVGDEAPTN